MDSEQINIDEINFEKKIKQLEEDHKEQLQREIEIMQREVNTIRTLYNQKKKYICQTKKIKQYTTKNLIKPSLNFKYEPKEIAAKMKNAAKKGNSYISVKNSKLNTDIVDDLFDKGYRIYKQKLPLIYKILNNFAVCFGLDKKNLVKISWK